MEYIVLVCEGQKYGVFRIYESTYQFINVGSETSLTELDPFFLKNINLGLGVGKN